jgi:hypothetical protein
MGGTYRLEPTQNVEGLGYRITTSGTATNPLIYRAMPGQRVIIDGGMALMGTSHVWLWELETTVSDLVEGKPPYGMSGSWPSGAPNGGFAMYSSQDCKFINLTAINTRQNFNLWTEAQRAEMYGCISVDPGWVGSDRSHGHGLYLQNPASTTKRVENCVFVQNKKRDYPDGRYELHGYGERVAVTNVTVKDCMGAQSGNAWLLDDGALLGPSSGHHFLGNAIYGVRVRLGSRPDQPLEFRGNVVAGELQMSTGAEVSQSGNLVAPPQPRPTTAQIIVKPNKYDPARAHVMLIDWPRRGKVVLDASGWIAAGEKVKVCEPWGLWDTPVFSGSWPAGGLELPVDGARIVILQKQTAPGTPSAVIREEAPVSPRLRRR